MTQANNNDGDISVSEKHHSAKGDCFCSWIAVRKQSKTCKTVLSQMNKLTSLTDGDYLLKEIAFGNDLRFWNPGNEQLY